MSDLRHDPINDQWVTIARNRRDRPMEFVPLEQVRQQLICPFCKGNEEETPAALAAYGSDGQLMKPDADPTGWAVRVIPNRYPSFSSSIHAMQTELVTGSQDYGPYQTNRSHGIQELIIPSSRHITSLSELTDEELKISFLACQDRIKNARSVEFVKHAMLFMNCRLEAGASLGHVHSQLLASPVVGSKLRCRADRNDRHFRKTGNSLIESMMSWEIAQEARIVDVTENYCIVCPFASRFPFQVWIIPRIANFSFMNCLDAERDELAIHCRNLVKRLETLLDNPAYNLLFHMDPFDETSHGHGFVELFPRLTRAAGFELGTDVWVNPVPPEAAARRLRLEE